MSFIIGIAVGFVAAKWGKQIWAWAHDKVFDV